MAERRSRVSEEERQREADEIQDHGAVIIQPPIPNGVFRSRYIRFCNQKEAWKEHLIFFKTKILIVFICSLFITGLFVYAFFADSFPFVVHTAVAILAAANFSFYWVNIPEGPPFLARKNGSIIRSEYLSRFG
ncbi:hypothetical protein HNY73_002691 [Argiope bruennichi]|uniref:Uncharacterized protein n=1 Tax=Argiope bruennichi TaxID=94029 RepID=A0A8T0FYU4_ARGBR|nr:hypothetical protein HNY73_002691 [Argiope bruennichi]